MCQPESVSCSLRPLWELLLVLVPAVCAWWNLRKEILVNRKSSLEMFNLQERKQDARANIPAVIEILEDLADLEQAFIFRGRFISGLEHRCPDIRLEDSEAEDQMSVAERTHQLRLIARRILRNCRKVIFLTPKSFMPETVEVCKAIVDAWMSKKPGQKHTYVIKINHIGSILQAECDRRGLSSEEQKQVRALHKESCAAAEKACDVVAGELEKFQDDLEARVAEEFPTHAQTESAVTTGSFFPQIFRRWWEKLGKFWNGSE